MRASTSPIHAAQWYETNADFVFEEYERIEFATLHARFLEYLPKQRCAILEVGAGTGRDAAGLAKLGHHVLAVEPSDALRRRAQVQHERSNIEWISDQLPELTAVTRRGKRYDVVFLSAVWMHLAPAERHPAFERIVDLLNPGGLLYLTLRHGPFKGIKGFWDVCDGEILYFARRYGLVEILQMTESDHLGRAGITWGRFILRSNVNGLG